MSNNEDFEDIFKNCFVCNNKCIEYNLCCKNCLYCRNCNIFSNINYSHIAGRFTIIINNYKRKNRIYYAFNTSYVDFKFVILSKFPFVVNSFSSIQELYDCLKRYYSNLIFE